MKLPAIQFYVGDWRKDPGVQSLDYFSRGVWFEILLFMHESEQRGLLLLNGSPPTTEQLAQMLGLTSSKTEQTLAKLIANGVASTEQNSGALMCRKMYNLHEVRARAGRIGGSKAQAKLKQAVKQTRSPSFSSSFSSSISKQKDRSLSEIREFFKTKGSKESEADKFFNFYESNGWRVGKNPMKNWRAAAAGWINRSGPTPAKNGQPARMKQCYDEDCKKMIPEPDWNAHMAEHMRTRKTPTGSTALSSMVSEVVKKK